MQGSSWPQWVTGDLEPMTGVLVCSPGEGTETGQVEVEADGGDIAVLKGTPGVCSNHQKLGEPRRAQPHHLRRTQGLTGVSTEDSRPSGWGRTNADCSKPPLGILGYWPEALIPRPFG